MGNGPVCFGAAQLVLGIDGGGSKTLLAMATRAGEVVALWRGGGMNPFDQTNWRTHLAAVIDRIGPARSRLQAAAAGLPGYGELESVSSALAEALASALPCRHTLHNDVQVAFDGAFGDSAGVLVLAGTGSMAWAQTQAADAPLRVGGWGHDIGDEGSAFWIGQRAVALVSQALDGRIHAADFAAAIFARIDAPATSSGLLGWYYGLSHRRAEVAVLARTVSALAESGEPVGARLIEEAADHLCTLVHTARRRIGMAESAWSHAGGLFESSVLRHAMIARLGPPVAPLLPPVGGALWRAARLAGWTTDATWTARLATSLDGFVADPASLHQPASLHHRAEIQT